VVRVDVDASARDPEIPVVHIMASETNNEHGVDYHEFTPWLASPEYWTLLGTHQ